MKSSKFIRILSFLFLLFLLTFGGYKVVTRQPGNQTTRQLTPVLPQEGFGIFTTPTPAAINVDIPDETFPQEVSTYQILPAPYELFSPEAAQVIAQNLGFTQNATAKTIGNLYIYTEGAKTLSIDKVAGFINYSIPLTREELGQGSIDEGAARSKARQFFKNLGLDQPFFNWEKAKAAAFALENGSPKETALTSETSFLQFTPEFKIHDFPLETPQPIFVRVSKAYEIIGLSFWYPNFDWNNPQKVKILSVNEARKKVEAGEGNLISKTNESLSEVDLTTIELIHYIPGEYLTDFSTPSFTKPMFVFGGEKAKVYLEAIE